MYGKIRRYFIYFVLYSVIGWLYEVFLETVVYGWGFSNRGVLFGPYCPVYGTGALVFVFCFYRLIKNRSLDISVMSEKGSKKGKGLKKIVCCFKPLILFLCCMVTATLLELITSYILEFATGSWPWQTYDRYKINFQGRIALSPSVRFGLGGVLILYLIQPFFEMRICRLSNKTERIIFIILAAVFIIDIIYSMIKYFV